MSRAYIKEVQWSITESLCRTCTYAHTMIGYRESENGNCLHKRR